jgi:hypothetical protein
MGVSLGCCADFIAGGEAGAVAARHYRNALNIGQGAGSVRRGRWQTPSPNAKFILA